MKLTRLLPLVPLLISLSSPAFGADEGKIGKLTVEEFNKTTDAGVDQIKAVKATETPLNDVDKKWLTDITSTSMMQMEAARVAIEKSDSKDIKTFAQADLNVSKSLTEKLQEIAKAKGTEAPSKLSAKMEKDIADLRAKSGKGLDAAYLMVAGVQGNEALWLQLSKLEKATKDEDLKSLLKGALPLVRMHTKAAKAESEDDD